MRIQLPHFGVCPSVDGARTALRQSVVDEGRREQIGVRTANVVRAPMTRSIRANGPIPYDESRLEDVVLKLGGFISKLHTSL